MEEVEVLEKAVSKINLDAKDQEERMPFPFVYNYVIYWQHLYFNKSKELIGKSDMYRNSHIRQLRPLSLGDSKNIIGRLGRIYLCKTSLCAKIIKDDEDIIPLYKKNY